MMPDIASDILLVLNIALFAVGGILIRRTSWTLARSRNLLDESEMLRAEALVERDQWKSAAVKDQGETIRRLREELVKRHMDLAKVKHERNLWRDAWKSPTKPLPQSLIKLLEGRESE